MVLSHYWSSCMTILLAGFIIIPPRTPFNNSQNYWTDLVETLWKVGVWADYGELWKNQEKERGSGIWAAPLYNVRQYNSERGSI